LVSGVAQRHNARALAAILFPIHSSTLANWQGGGDCPALALPQWERAVNRPYGILQLEISNLAAIQTFGKGGLAARACALVLERHPQVSN